jgi:hypothetical protein
MRMREKMIILLFSQSCSHAITIVTTTRQNPSIKVFFFSLSLSSVIDIICSVPFIPFVLRWSAVKAIVVLACSAAPSGSTVVVATIVADKSNIIAVGASYHGMSPSGALRCS